MCACHRADEGDWAMISGGWRHVARAVRPAHLAVAGADERWGRPPPCTLCALACTTVSAHKELARRAASCRVSRPPLALGALNTSRRRRELLTCGLQTALAEALVNARETANASHCAPQAKAKLSGKRRAHSTKQLWRRARSTPYFGRLNTLKVHLG